MAKISHLISAALVLTLQSGCSSAPVEVPTDAASEAVVADGPTVMPTSSLAEPNADKTQVVPHSFRAIGTEPFWSAQVEGAMLTWSTPEQPGSLAVPVTRKERAGGAILNAMIDGQVLELEITGGPCSDGMSDVVYPLSVTRRLDGDTQRGCAR